MSTKTKTLNVRITDGQYEELEEFVDRGEYTYKAEFTRELLREKFEEFSIYLHPKAEKDRAKHISFEEYGKSRGLGWVTLFSSTLMC